MRILGLTQRNANAKNYSCRYLGTSIINLGTRQNDRLSSSNVINSAFDNKSITRSISMINLKKIKNNEIKLFYGKGRSYIKSFKIIKNLLKVKLKSEKKFIERKFK